MYGELQITDDNGRNCQIVSKLSFLILKVKGVTMLTLFFRCHNNFLLFSKSDFGCKKAGSCCKKFGKKEWWFFAIY
jgi:hypothetical protein